MAQTLSSDLHVNTLSEQRRGVRVPQVVDAQRRRQLSSANCRLEVAPRYVAKLERRSRLVREHEVPVPIVGRAELERVCCLARSDPKTFLTLLGKLVPAQVRAESEDGIPLVIFRNYTGLAEFDAPRATTSEDQ